jgi:hypothetical protein
MSWKGALLRAGIRSDGVNITLPGGNFAARNFIVPSGQVWYVNKNNSVTGNGTSWELAFKTVTEAIAAAGDYDTILIEEGVYDEGAVLNITQKGLRIFGMNTTNYMYGTTSLKASAANHVILEIQADQVEIAFLSFIQNNANKVISINHTAAVYKTHIHDCHFGSATATYGVYAGATFDAVDTIVERCSFTVGATVGVYFNATRCAVVDCTFNLAAGGTAIQHAPDTADRPYTRYIGNRIMGVNSTDTGILISNTPTLGCLTIFDNVIENVATPITLAKYTQWYSNNYLGVYDHLYRPNVKDLTRNAHGDIWYVDKNASTAGDGRCWKSAFKTVTAALAVAGDYDTIVIEQGVYDEGAVLNLTQKGLTLKGSNTSGYMYGTTSLKASAADHIIITIAADQIEICNLSFIQNNAKAVIAIDHTAAVYKTHIHDCHFGSATATYGIDAGGTFDAVDTIIERCGFVCGGNVGVRMNATRAAIIDCTFQIGTAGEGYVHTPGTADRPYTRVVGCRFFTEDVTNGVGITVTNTPTAGMFFVDDCHFAYFADDNHAVSKRTGYCGLNWRDAAVLPVT